MKYKIITLFAAMSFAIGLYVIHHPSKSLVSKAAKIAEPEEGRSLALDALQFTTAAAAYPDKDIPPSAYASAIKWYKDNASVARFSVPGTSWQNMGPVNIGGRTVAIAIDPTDTSVLWMGSASGGLWKSTTGGVGAAAWKYVPLGYPVLGIGSIAIDPQDHNIMYVGTGEVYSDSSYSQGLIELRPTRGSYGMGLFKSTDGGNTWTQSINWSYQQNSGISSIVINPLNPNVVYAGTTFGVYKTTNAGATWTKVLGVAMAMDLLIHNVDTNIILCGVGNYGSSIHGIYRSTNSGATWTLLTNGLPPANNNGRITLTAYARNNDTMLAHICDMYNTVGVYLSSDKGNSWILKTTQNISSYQGWYSKGMVMKPGSPDSILMGGVDLFLSANGGASFADKTQYSLTFHSDVHDIVLNPQDSRKVYIITDGGLFRSNDFGNSYSWCSGGYVTTQSYIGSISSTDTTKILSGVQDNYTIKYTAKYTGPKTWSSVIGGDGCYNAIDHTNDQYQFGAYQYLNVFGCSDSGWFNNWWSSLTNSNNAASPNYAAFLAPYIICYSNTQIMYAGGLGLQQSTDEGLTWSFMGNNPVHDSDYIMTIAASFTNTDSIYFATAPNNSDSMHVYSSADGGTTLKDISAGLPNRYPRRIAVNPSNSQELYIVFSGFGGKHVFHSTNGGGSWTDISVNLPDMPFECIVVDPLYPNNVYAGCDYGVFVSLNKGTTWNTYDQGFPDATMVFDLVISPSDRYLYAFTHGRGIFKRSLSDIMSASVKNTAAAQTVFKVFPNPAENEVQITTGSASKYFVYLYDINGKQISSSVFEGSSTVLPLNNLASGIYLIGVSNNGTDNQYTKVVKE